MEGQPVSSLVLDLEQVLGHRPWVIGMIHVWDVPVGDQYFQAREGKERLLGCSGLLVENYGWGNLDGNRVDPKVAGRMGEIMSAVSVYRGERLACGLNLLPNDYQWALTISEQSGGRFVQLDHVTGDYLGHDSVNPKAFMAARAQHPGIAVLGGIHPKYYHLVKPEPIEDAARRAVELTDAVVVTGNATGDPASLDDLRRVRDAVGHHPIIVGSGLNVSNAVEQLAIADGAIVGTAFKRGGVRPGEPIDPGLVNELMCVVERMRVARASAT